MGKSLAFGLAALLAAGAAHATDSRAIQALKGFLAAKDAEHRARYAGLLELGRASGYERIMQCLDQGKIVWPQGPAGATVQQIQALKQSFRHDITGFILGAGVASPTTCSAEAQSVNGAAARAIRGEVTQDDRIRFADTVVIARAVGGPNAGAADGYRSSLHFIVDEPIKGALRKGARFALRQSGGPDGQGGRIEFSGAATTHPGRLYLVMASRGMYTLSVAQGNKQLPATDRTSPGLVSFGGVLPVDQSRSWAAAPWGTIALDSVRSAARKHRATR